MERPTHLNQEQSVAPTDPLIAVAGILETDGTLTSELDNALYDHD
jgi:hypothetical protein